MSVDFEEAHVFFVLAIRLDNDWRHLEGVDDGLKLGQGVLLLSLVSWVEFAQGNHSVSILVVSHLIAASGITTVQAVAQQ